MQVVRVEFVTDFANTQAAIDAVSSVLPDMRNRPCVKGSCIESWNVYWVDETVVTKVGHYVEDGRVIYD